MISGVNRRYDWDGKTYHLQAEDQFLCRTLLPTGCS